MENYWQYRQGHQWKRIECPVPGLYDFEAQDSWSMYDVDKCFSAYGYDYMYDLKGFHSTDAIRVYEVEQQEDKPYRYVLYPGGQCGQDDFICLSNLPDLMSFMQLLVSVQGVVPPEEE